MDYKSLAKKIFDITGPTENILHAANCMTRLRLQLAQAAPEAAAQLKALEGVIGVNQTDTELQVILGPGAAEQTEAAFQQLLQAARTQAQAKGKAQPAPSDQGSQKQGHDITSGYGIGDGKKLHADIKAKNATPFKLLLKKISGIFIPLIPGFIACGLITGLLNLLLKAEPALADMAWIKMLAIMGNAIFYGMNLFVGFNAAKEFGGSPILGGILAAVITHPALKDIMLGSEQLQPGRGGIIAVLLVTAFGAR